MTTIYRVGERVDGLYDENTDDMWYPGRVRCVHQGEAEPDSADTATFEVLYDDGEVEMNVRPEFLRQHVPGTICVGTRVRCRYDGGEEFYPGQVSDVQENGRYTIAYDDGEMEEDVPIDNIMEEEAEEVQVAEEEGEDKVSSETTNDVSPDHPEQQQEEDTEMEEADDSPRNPADDAGRSADVPQESEESDGDTKSNEPNQPEENVHPPNPEPFQYSERLLQPARQNDDPSDTTPDEVSAERGYIIDSLQLLEKRLGDAASTKSVLSTLVKQMRAYPQVTADFVHERGGERLVIGALKFHQSHAVIQCYGFVLLRRLCFLCVKSTHYLLRNGVVEVVMQAMNAFAEDAILQASACGALAVFTRVHAGLNILIEYQVAQLVLSTLIYHKTYSVHTRQVHYYACEVLLELCELDDLQTQNLLCGEQEEDFTGDMSPISLLLFLLRQGLSLDDKKACCAVGSLLMCLAASGRRAAALILSLNGLAELSTVMARYPTEPSIQKYSAAASKQIAICSVRQSPTKRIQDTATEILREAESLENTPTEKPLKKRSGPRRSTSTGKRKSNPTTGYGAPVYPRGAAYSSNTPYRNSQGFSKVSSPYGQSASGFGGDVNSYTYPARDYPAAATAPQQPSRLVILDRNLGVDSGFGSTNKYKQLSKEDRQSELFDAYGIQGVPGSSSGRPYGTKRAQLRAHLASAESTWATPQQQLSSTSKPHSSRSEHLDHGPAYSHRDFMASRQNRWEFDNDEPHNAAYDTDPRQLRGAKRKKKNLGVRTAFQVNVENENQLRVSRETRSPYPSPQRLGVATKRAAKARQKRITATGHSSLTGRSNDASSESLNDYATQLFQDNASRAGVSFPVSSKLTPREKEEIRERERLSFAEKLHKMIDKAKSTLANGNATPVSIVDSVPRSQKSSASTKTARKPLSEDKRPPSKKTRAAVSSTPKNAATEVSSPREAAEARPAKPTFGATERPAASSDAPSAPVVSRPKPTLSRTVVAPKAAPDQKPRPAVKANKTAPTKSVKTSQIETPKELAAGTAPAKISPAVKAPEVDEPRQSESDVVVAQSVEKSAQSADKFVVPAETKPVVQVESAAGSSDKHAKVPSDVATTGVASTENVPGDEGNTGDLPGSDPGVEDVPLVAAPVEATTVNADDVLLAKEEGAVPESTADATVEATPERTGPAEVAQQAGVSALEEPSAVPEPTDDQPSGGSVAVDAMYGDAFSEFDDNGGDDEDMTVEAGADTDDTRAPVTGTSDLPTDIPLQESKSGEALYDDGYDEFDDDEAPHTEGTEAKDSPAEDAVDGEPSDMITQPAETESDLAVNVPEGEDEQLAEAETPVVAADEATSPPAEGDEKGGEGSLHDANVGEKGDAVAADPSENDPEAAQEAQSETADVDNAPEAAPSASVVSNVEDEQEPVNLDTDPVTEPCDVNAAKSDAQADAAVDENGDIGAPSDNAGESAPDGGNNDGTIEQDISLNADASGYTSVIEPAKTEGGVEDAEPSAQSAALLEDETAVVNPPDEADASSGPAAEEATANSAQLQQDEGSPAEETDTDEHPDEPLPTEESARSLEQDEESKKLTADSSVVSIQSAAYDEDNFDDEESHQEEEPGDAVELSPVAAPVEETVEVAEPEQQEDDSPDTKTAPVEDQSLTDPVGTIDRDENESKVLAANSSELSVQSATYEDEGFDDGTQEESHADNSEDNVAEQEPSVGEVADNTEVNSSSEPVVPVDNAPTAPDTSEDDQPEELTTDNEVLVAAPEAYGDKDFDSAALADALKETTAVSLAPETVNEPSEQQQPEKSDPTSTPESEVVAEPSLTVTESVAADQEASENVQEPVDVEAEKYDDDVQVDNADEADTEGDSASAAEPGTDDHVESSDPVPVTADSSATDSSFKTDTPEGEAPVITIPAEAESAQEDAETPPPEAYDDDDFGNGVEEENVTPSAVTGQPSDEGGHSVAVKTDNAADPVAVEDTSSESEPPTSDQPEQLDESRTDDTADSRIVLDKADDSVSRTTPEPEVAAEILSDDVREHVGSPVEGEAKVDPASDDAGNFVSEVARSEPESRTATSDEQPDGQEYLISPDEKPDASFESENAADRVQAENVPEAEARSDNPVEGGDALVKDSTESNPAPAVVGTSAEPSGDATHEEIQYEDDNFDAAEDDTTANGVASENDPIQCDFGARKDCLLPAETSQPEETAPVVSDDGEAPASDATKEEAAAQPADVQTSEAGLGITEAVADTNEDVTVEVDEQPKGDAAVEVDDQTSASVGSEANNATIAEADVKDEPPASRSGDEEDSPDQASLEMHEDTAVNTATTSVENEAADNESAPTEAESPAIGSSPSNEVYPPDENDSAQPSSDVLAVSDLPSKDEHYDDGFDDDPIVPGIDPSDSSNPGDTSSLVDPVSIVNADADPPESSAVAEPTEDNVVVESKQAHEDQNESNVLDTNPVESTAQDEADTKAKECDVASAAEVETTEAPVETEPAEVDGVKPETVEPVSVESEAVEPVTVESEGIEPEAAATDSVEPVESEAVEAEAIKTDAVEPEAGEPEVLSSETVEIEAVGPDSDEPHPTEQPTAVEPVVTGSEAVKPDAAEYYAPKSEAADLDSVEPATLGDSALESSIADPTPEESAAPEAGQEELPTEPSETLVLADAVVGDVEDLLATEVPVEVPEDTPTDTNDPRSTDESEVKEESSQGGEPPAEEGAIDQPQREELVVDTISSSIEAPAIEIPVQATPDEPQDSVQSAAERTLAVEPPSSDSTAPVGGNVDDQAIASEPQPTTEVINDAVEVTGDDAATLEPTETIVVATEDAQPVVEDQAPVEPDYAETDAPAAESPVVAQDESAPTDAVVQEAAPEEPAGQGHEEAPKASAIEVGSPQSDEVAASEGPKTEDQYDDDEAYNDFDDQENEGTALASPPSVEVPAPAAPVATEAPATEDEYDEYENDDYGEDEKPAETPRADPVAPRSTRSEPPVSAREEEIEEVTDEPEEADEEAYADDQDAYEDDDAPAPVPAASSRKKDNPTPPAEASADEYEDDNEEDYAEDEIEDSSPPKPAPAPAPAPAAPATNKSDDEMDEELGYESDEGYADSDG
ncbi:hypothetical protein PHYPSEUDO_002405 [Phytophthora pseudosyringae]|uniref:Tudor domain-containing protein n=1 Tax=Phytophthora pseudosyringae TaxID=221518 RepID=A0A8T1VWN4_9STRA|nr:hypothetical protein PHYPSEUDO_002405 [Phytophthora pseudosyringae]